MRSRGGGKDHGGTSATPRMLCCLLVFLAVFLCLQQVCYFWGSDDKKVIMMEAVEKYRNGSEPQALLYPVWWYAPFFTGSGYGTEAISYVVSLVQTKLIRRQDIWLTHSGDAVHEGILNTMEPSVRDVLKSQEHNNMKKAGMPEEELDRPAIVICHSFPECWRLPTDGDEMESPGCPCPDPNSDEQVAYRVGRTMFETATLPAHLVEHCNAMDEVWVPTEFNKETFMRSGVHQDKLRVVPQGIDTDFFDPVKYEPLSLKSIGAEQATGPKTQPNTSYVFLSIFKWEARKGWDVLLESYLSEFSAKDPVELHILTHPFITDRRDFSDQIRNWVKGKFKLNSDADFDRMARVYVYHKHISDDLYPRIYKSANSVVLPTRGEGWGRPQMEAMAMGIPVITTNWSGPTAFMNEDVGYPLSIDGLVDIVADGPHFFSYFVGSQWAQPSATHLRHLMRKVYSDPTAAAAKGMMGRRHIQKYFTPEVIALTVMKEIRRIEQKLGGIIVKVVRPKLTKIAKSLCVSYPQLCVNGQESTLEMAMATGKSKGKRGQSQMAASAAEALKQRPLCQSYPQLCQYKNKKGGKKEEGS